MDDMTDPNTSVYYVYALFRPNGTPCYIGKGKGRRWRDHFTRTTNKHLGRIIKQAGGELPLVKLRDQISEREALETEIALIRAIGRTINGGPLVNGTDGGEGVSGHAISDEHRATLSEQMKLRAADPQWREDAATRSKAMWADPETRAMLLEAHQNLPPPTAEARLKMSANMKVRWEDPEYRATKSAQSKAYSSLPESKARTAATLGASNKGKIATADTRAKIAAARQGTRASPETRAKMSASGKGRVFTPEHRANLSAAASGKQFSAEHCANISKAKQGIIVTAETRAKLSIASTGRRHTAETRARISATHVGMGHTPETRAKMSVSAKARVARERDKKGVT